MEEFEQTFVFTGTAQELEADARGAYRPDHGCHFNGRLMLGEKHLKVENIVDLDHRLALDNASAHGNISHHAGPANPAAGKRQGQSDGDAFMLSTIEEMFRVVPSNVKRQEPVAACLTSKRRDEQQHGDAFGVVKTVRPQNAVFSAIRTVKYSRHRAPAE